MDRALAIREAVVTTLRASDGVTARVSAIYGERVPLDHPSEFISLSDPTAAPFRMSCYNGEVVSFSVHVFVGGPSNDDAARVMGEVKRELDGANLATEGEDRVDLIWQNSNLVSNGDERWHGILDFTAA